MTSRMVVSILVVIMIGFIHNDPEIPKWLSVIGALICMLLGYTNRGGGR